MSIVLCVIDGTMRATTHLERDHQHVENTMSIVLCDPTLQGYSSTKETSKGSTTCKGRRASGNATENRNDVFMQCMNHNIPPRDEVA
jgi:hypothetical protein